MAWLRVLALVAAVCLSVSSALVPVTTELPIQSLKVYSIGSSALYLVWKKPEQENGALTGYKIYYQTVEGTNVGPLMERKPNISDPNTTRTKLAELEPGTKYRIHVKAMTSAGESEGYCVEQRTKGSPTPPDKPTFKLEQLPFRNNNPFRYVMVTWTLNLDGNPGSYFFVKFKLKGVDDVHYAVTYIEPVEDSVVVYPLKIGQVYEFKIVASDGYSYSTESDVQELEIVNN